MTRKKTTTARKPKMQPAPAAKPTTILSYKGFNNDFTCRGVKFEIGKTYTVEGNARCCENGFHACPQDLHPLTVFKFYRPGQSRYGLVEQSGDICRREGDKAASTILTLKAEVKLPEIIQAAVKWVFDRAKWQDGAVAKGPHEGATASGNYGAATASGCKGRAKGANGCVLFLVERDDNWKIVAAWAGIVGKDGIKADTWYTLTKGKPVEVRP